MMDFDALDQKMRAFEAAQDRAVPTGTFIVARMDGRGFTKLTKDTHSFEKPFDPRFRDFMAETAKQLMDCGFQAIYGYTQSDEISILIHPQDQSFGRKTRKLISVLAGEASARFSVLLGAPAAFDARLSELPELADVLDYFRWRMEDAHRNSLNAHCYWLLRKNGLTARAATREIEGISVKAKIEKLAAGGVDFDAIPVWQKRGLGLAWENYEKSGLNPKTGETLSVRRRRVHVLDELPSRENYENLIRQLICESLEPG